nr:hypothetical protein [Tanacetum cinerariifolium]
KRRPVSDQQLVDQRQGVGQPGKSVEGQSTLEKEMSNAQVFAALQKIGSGLFDLTPLRWFCRLNRVPHGALWLALGVAFQLQKVRVIFQVNTTWGIY